MTTEQLIVAEINCSDNSLTYRSMTNEEIEQHQKNQEAFIQKEAEREAAEAAKAAAKASAEAKLAALGLTPEEIAALQ
jgi:hypothetical protein